MPRGDHGELLDPVVKNAMAHAVNRDKIIETVYNGRAAPAASILTLIAGDYLDPTIEPEAYDLPLANQLLDDAGYTKGADGIRTTPAGERMSTTMRTRRTTWMRVHTCTFHRGRTYA